MDVGQILKPQGIRGEIKVKPLTDDPSRFRLLKTVTIGGAVYRIERARIAQDGVYIKLFGVNDRNAAEMLRNKFISIERVAAVALDDDEFFIADLTNAELAVRSGADSRVVGNIIRIDSYGAADVFTVSDKDGKTFSFAFIKALEPEFDAQTRTLYVDEARLAEVAVYED